MTVQFIVALLFIIPYDLMQISSIYCSLSNIIYNVILMYYMHRQSNDHLIFGGYVSLVKGFQINTPHC